MAIDGPKNKTPFDWFEEIAFAIAQRKPALVIHSKLLSEVPLFAAAINLSMIPEYQLCRASRRMSANPGRL